MEPSEYQTMAALEADFWWYRAMHQAATARLRRYVPRERFALLLDAGCGTGGFLRHWREQPEYQRAFGIDLFSEACTSAKAKTTLDIVQGRVDQLPLADNSLPLITCHDVLYHRAVDEPKALKEWHRCLQPAGYLSVQVAAYQWLHSAHDEQVHGARRYTETELCHKLRLAGFDIVASGYWNSLLFPLMAASRLFNKNQTKESDVKPLANWLNTLLFNVVDCERRIHLRLPFGGTTWAIARKQL